MQLKAFSSCCTAQIIIGFGKNKHNFCHVTEASPDTKEELVEELDKVIAAGRATKLATLVAMINSDQADFATEALTNAGFIPSKWMNKEKEASSCIQLWYLPLNETFDDPWSGAKEDEPEEEEEEEDE